MTPSSADTSPSQLIFYSLFGSAEPGTVPGIFRFIAPGPNGTIYLGGWTGAGNFPITPNALQPSPAVTPAPDVPFPQNPFLAVIDPSRTGQAQLIYSTYFGTSGHPGAKGKNRLLDFLFGFAVDKAGRFYVCGGTGSLHFPVTSDAFQTTLPRARAGFFSGAGFFSVIDPNLSGSNQLVYSTYLGGQKGSSHCNAVSVDDNGRAYLTGDTNASDFPLTRNAFQRQERGFRGNPSNSFDNAFVTVIDPARSGPSGLVYSSFLGGGHQAPNEDNQGDVGLAIAVGPGGLIYVGGDAVTTDFPVTLSAFQNHFVRSTLIADSENGFLSVLNPARTGAAGLVYSTYLGGDSAGGIISVAADTRGDAYVGGQFIEGTGANAFPTTPNAFQPRGGGFFATISKIDPFKSGKASLPYSTIFDGLIALGFALDSRGFVYVAGGFDLSEGVTFPITPDAFQATLNPGDPRAGFLSIFDPLASGNASLLYSTFLGHGGGAPGTVFVDSAGKAYLAGRRAGLPVTPDSFQPTGTTFVAILNPPVPSTHPLSVRRLPPRRREPVGQLQPALPCPRCADATTGPRLDSYY